MSAKKDYIINFIGLRNGIHQFQYHIDSLFFKDYEHSIVSDGQVEVKLSLEKKSEIFMIADLTLEGNIILTCDRCLDEYPYQISSTQQVFIKLSDKHTEVDDSEEDDIIFLPILAQTLDVSPLIYEFINLCVPLQSICSLADKACNEEMLKRIANYNLPDSDSGNSDDPRWDALRNINNN